METTTIYCDVDSEDKLEITVEEEYFRVASFDNSSDLADVVVCIKDKEKIDLLAKAIIKWYEENEQT